MDQLERQRWPMLAGYRRRLAAFLRQRRDLAGREMTADELVQVLGAAGSE